MGDRLDKLTRCGWKLYSVSPYLTFALRDDRAVILTPLCSYILDNSRLNSRAGHQRIINGILQCRYTDISEVLTDMRLTPGLGVGYRQVDIRSLYV